MSFSKLISMVALTVALAAPGFSQVQCQKSIVPGTKGNCGQPTVLTTCQQFMAAGLPCVPVTSLNQLPSVAVAAPAFIPGGWGTTAAQIGTNFGYSQYLNFANNSNINTQIANMDLFSMSRLSTEMVRIGSVYLPYVLEEAAMHLTAANLAYMRRAFGPTVDSYVNSYAPATIAAQYRALPQNAPLLESTYYAASGHAAYVPPADMSPYDLYLDIYLAATTPTNNRAAIHQMVLYRSKFGLGALLEVLGKFAGGIGTVYGIAKAVDPDLDHQLALLAQYMGDNELLMYSPTVTITPEGPDIEGPPTPPPPPNVEIQGPPTPDTDYGCFGDTCPAPT